MTQRSLTRAALLLAVAATVRAGAVGREAVVREMLERSRLLEDVHFKVPLPLWRRYVQETATGAARRPAAPVPMIAEEGIYHLTVSADQSASLAVTLRLRVFDPHGFASAAALSTKRAWEDVKVKGQPADLLPVGEWLRFVAVEPGFVEITTTAPLKPGTAYGGSCELDIPPTVRTLVRFDSPGAWEVAAADAASRVRGSQEQGTHGQIALTPRGRLRVTWQRPAVLTDRPPRYQLSGAVAWNLDAAVQQVSARLNVAIVGGRTERLVLNLPSSADRVSVTGPDVRDTRVNGGSAAVHLRGKIGGQTRLHVQYEMPLARTGLQRLGGLAVRDGHWAGGTLVVTNTAGGSEVLAESLVGLRELALSEVPDEAAAILAGPPVLACAITSRQWSAEVDVVDLGEFALRESVADLAHYELAFRGDGTMVCKATYEIRNRTRQFLRLDLPRGATVLLARVNEKTRPLAPVPGEADAWLLPLIRSKASVKGLVTFPIELVLMCRTDGLARRGEAALPLPRIDLPIAYAWCEAYVPQDMHVRRWTGPLRRVEQYSSETAKATLSYGRGLAAEGYKPKARPTAKPRPKPEPKEKPPQSKMPEPDKKPPKPSIQPPSTTPAIAPKDSKVRLARNYYRAGKDSYERQDYAKAADHFKRVLKDFPKSPEAYNATRFLANIDLARGKLKLRSRAEKAAGAQVRRGQALASRKQEEQQQEFLVKGLKAAREGRLAEAKAQFQAAGSLSGKLLEQGADQREQHARLKVVHEKLAEVRKKEAAKASKLLKEVEDLERKGDYKAALKTAQRLRQYESVGKGRLRTKIEELTVEATRRESRQHRIRQLEEQRRELVCRVKADEGDAIDAADRGMDKDDEASYLGRLEKDVKRLTQRIRKQRPDVYAEAIRGKVTAVDPKLGLVVLNAGQRAGVRKGHSFIVFRGSQYVGKVVVDEVFPDVAAAHYSRPDMKTDVDVGDDLTTRLTVGFDTADGPISHFGRTGKATLRMYGVADLTIDHKAFKGRQQALAGDLFGDEDEKEGEEETLTGEKLVEFIKRSIAPGTWATPEEMIEGPTYRIQYRNGRIVVEGTPEQQKQVDDFLQSFRKARGPQVQLGANIAQQRAQGQVAIASDGGYAATGGGKVARNELRRFVARNYDWQVGRARSPGGQEVPMTDLPKTLEDLVGDLSEQVGLNLGQKVQVSSINLDIPAQAANQLGVTFQTGNNGVMFTVCDEAQFRTLTEFDARKSGAGRSVAANPNWQDTIVGTDALLANGWTCNVRFGADVGNTLDINDNPINLEHDKYILIDNGSFLTAVRAGVMQHWMQRAARVQFAEVPQDIDVPRVGQMLRFEKSLVKPTDELVIRATYTWKGEGR